MNIPTDYHLYIYPYLNFGDIDQKPPFLCTYINKVREHNLFKSFIKGLGQATATITILGVAGVTWYVYNNNVNKVNKTTSEPTTIILEDIDNVSNVDFRKIFVWWLCTNINLCVFIFFKTHIRNARNELFPDLDVQYMRALESGNQTKIEEIVQKKETLRNITNIDYNSIIKTQKWNQS